MHIVTPCVSSHAPNMVVLRWYREIWNAYYVWKEHVFFERIKRLLLMNDKIYTGAHVQ